MEARLRGRRERVMNALGEDAALILAATPELTVGRDTELRYVVDPELYYLTGYREPDAVAVLAPGNQEARFTLFVRPRDPARELWAGPRGGVEAATEQFGADAGLAIAELDAKLPALLAGIDTIYARLDVRPEVDALIRRALLSGSRKRARTGRGPHTLTDPGVLLDEMRAVKDAHEIALLRRAAEITVAGFFDAAAHIQPGAGEWQIEAALEAGFRSRGADGSAFPTIAASGPNATVLHYISNQGRMQSGELLLLDAGARFRMYCGDVSRTFPVNGCFSPPQRALYDTVLRAHGAAIAAARPGAAADEMHRAALSELIAGLRELRLITASLDQAFEDESVYQRFYPHRTSHWLGLETHDAGAYAYRSGPRRLEAGMVLTIEPALYVPIDVQEAPAELRGAGVRIEDDLLITEQGGEVLSRRLPTRAEDVEALLRENG